MKKLLTLSLLLLVGAGLALFVYADSGGRPGRGMGPRDGMHGGGHGKGHGMERGMRGAGHGRGHGKMPYLAGLSEAQRNQVEQIHLAMRQAMLAKRLERRTANRKLREALGAYPLRREAAEKLFQSLVDIRRGMFQLRLDTMTQMQQVLGEELWGKMHSRHMERMEGPRMRHRR
ncbi:MAG: Spy/CpxP family protein refolding chaperone [SAR324 cluster bacterium]|nr:Spy/CpxP family protein refolding chaperone [SAR324 cluster bacterium]